MTLNSPFRTPTEATCTHVEGCTEQARVAVSKLQHYEGTMKMRVTVIFSIEGAPVNHVLLCYKHGEEVVSKLFHGLAAHDAREDSTKEAF